MEKKNVMRCMLVVVMVGLANSDIEKDREECANQLVGLATCLPYVSGDGKAPTIDCCTGLKQVLKSSKKCLCILVKDRNDPSLGLKINATLALSLPTACHAPADVSKCPELLHLPPNSPDSKVFEDFVDSAKGSSNRTTLADGKSNSTSSNGSSAEIKSEAAGRGKRWFLVEIVFVAITSVVVPCLL